MTIDEARILAEIVSTADGGCKSCVSDLCGQLTERFPLFAWTPRDWYSKTQRVEVTAILNVVAGDDHMPHWIGAAFWPVLMPFVFIRRLVRRLQGD